MSEKTFVSEEEKQKAIDAIPEIPPDGKNANDWAEEVQRQIEEILNAPVGEPAKEEVVEAPTEIKAEDERQAAFEAERAKLKQQHEEEMAKIRKDLETAKAQPANAGKTAAEVEFETMQAEANALETALEKVDDPLDDPDYTTNMKKLTLLNRKLFRAHEKVYAERDQLRVQEIKKAQDAAEAERLKSIKAKEEKEQSDRVVTELEEFRKTRKELQSGQPFTKDAEEFGKFSLEVANAYWGNVNPGEWDKIEMAMARYREGTPVLMEKVKAKGLKPPKGLTQYMTISEVDMLMKGLKLNTTTGQWEPVVNKFGQRVSFPDHETAYEYLQRSSGKQKNVGADARRQGAEDMARVLDQRSPARELDESQRNGADELDLPNEELMKLYEAFDETQLSMLYSRDPNDPKLKQFDQVATKLGLLTSKDIFG
jgi:hypothetical protein